MPRFTYYSIFVCEDGLGQHKKYVTILLLVHRIFTKKGLDPELHGGQLISSPGDSIVSLVSPKKVTDPTLWGKFIFRPRPFSLLAKNATGGHNA